MKQHDIKKLHQMLVAKKFRYRFKKLVLNLQTLIVDFIPLNEIPLLHCAEKIVLEEEIEVESFLPKLFDGKAISEKHRRSAIVAYSLQNVLAHGECSFFVNKNMTKLYYEKMHNDNRTFYIYNNETLIFHSEKLAKIRNYPVISHSFDAIFFGGNFTGNYYHFLIEILSKAEYFSRIPDHKNLKVVFDIAIRKDNNLLALVEFFFQDYELVFLEKDFYYDFKTLWSIETPNPAVPNVYEGTKYEAKFGMISTSSIRYLREICFKNYNENKVNIAPISKMFILRKSHNRKYNQTELLNTAKIYGFEPVYFEDLNIHEQMFLLKNAEYVIGASGAAWTNLVFANKNGKGLTWMGSVSGDFSIFTTIANIVGFQLYTMKYENTSKNIHEDYILDEKEFEINIKKLLSL